MLLLTADRLSSGVHERTNRIDQLLPLGVTAAAKELLRDLAAETRPQSDYAPVGE